VFGLGFGGGVVVGFFVWLLGCFGFFFSEYHSRVLEKQLCEVHVYYTTYTEMKAYRLYVMGDIVVPFILVV